MRWLSLACFVLAALATSAFGSDPPKPPPPQPPPDTGAADAAAAEERRKAAQRRGAGANRLTDPRGTSGDYAALGRQVGIGAVDPDAPTRYNTKLGG